MHFSSKFNAQRGAKRAGLDPETLEFFKEADGYTWRDKPKPSATMVVILQDAGDVDYSDRTGQFTVGLTPDPACLGDPIATMCVMVARPEGATVTELAEATGLSKEMAHAQITTRLKKRLGLKIDSGDRDRDRGGRIYRAIGAIVAPEFPLFQGVAA